MKATLSTPARRALALALIASLPHSGSAQPPTLPPKQRGTQAIVYDAALSPIPGTLTALSGRTAMITTDGRETTIQNAVAVLFPQATRPAREADAAPTITLDLADGQRWIFPLPAVKFAGEVVQTPTCPEGSPLKLDQVRRVVLDTTSTDAPIGSPPPADTARLGSGDQITGFVASINTLGKEGAFTVAIERAGATTPLAHTTLRTLTLTTPPSPRQSVTAWLADGQRLDASATLAEGQWSIQQHTPAGPQRHTLPPGMLEGVLLAPSEFVPLLSLPGPTVVGATAGVEPPVRGPERPLGLQDLLIPEPQTLTWTLPPSASRLGAMLALREDCRAWGDCTATLTFARAGQSAELFKGTLTGMQPIATVAVDIPPGTTAGTLTLAIDAGRNGPIQDRVVLRAGVVKLSNSQMVK